MALRVSSFPSTSSNPYLDLFYSALRPAGVVRGEEFLLSPRWLVSKRQHIDAIHFHWPEALWRSREEGSVRALAKLRVMLQLAGALGIKRMWTVHNLDPHEGGGRIHRYGQQLLATHCDLVIVHSADVKDEVQRRFSGTSVVVMPHGNYAGQYPMPRPSSAFVDELNPRGKPLLCCLGWLRAYKGFDVACRAMSELGEEAHLVIAGSPHDGFDPRQIERLAADLPQVTLLPRALDPQEFADLHAAAEAIVLPYRRITTSGALLAAWTQGCGVIASDLPFFRQAMAGAMKAGTLFKTGDAESLAQAIRSYLAVPRHERSAAAYAMAAQYPWERCVEPVGEVLQRWQQAEPEEQALAASY